MKLIKFSHNWNNKLNNPIFNTIRKSTPEKLKYYKDSVGYGFDVLLKGKKYCYAELQEAEEFLFDDVPNGLIMMDTGMDLTDAQQLFSDFGITYGDKIIILTFQRIERKDTEPKQEVMEDGE